MTVTTWHQLHFQCKKSNVELAESLLMEEGALSIVFEDAGDQPLFEPMPGQSPLWDEVIVTGIFSNADLSDDTKNSDEAKDSDETKEKVVADAMGLESYYYDIAQLIANEIEASRVWMTTVEDKDWEREWMSHYHPIECAHNLWIVPNWITPPNPNAINIIMDPGLAFGTGYHATTRLCLDWLSEQKLASKLEGITIIDYGCGSGILGIAALLLGAAQVYAVDIDPQAVLATKQNATRNHVNDKLQAFLPHEFEEFCKQNTILPVDTITANILAKPLMQLAPYFATLLKPEGDIVLSGLIVSQIEEVRHAYDSWFVLDESFSFTDNEDKHWQRLSGRRIIE